MLEAAAGDPTEGRHDVLHFELHGALGTMVDLRVAPGRDSPEPAALEAFVSGELARLERVFSVFDDDSDLCRWRRGELDRPGTELCDLLGHVERWQERTGGVFNPLAGELSELWRHAEQRDQTPQPAELAEAAASIAATRFEIVDGLPVRTGDCSRLNLNAIAKGYLIDRTCAATMDRFEVDAISLNVGGDLRHVGRGAVSVGIENPLRPYDNEPPIAVVNLVNAALATSGSARRGFRVGGQWFSHVLDPRSGRPASGPASVSVAAADVMTADVAATVATVFEPGEAVEWLTSLDDIGGLVIGRDGDITPTPGWTDRFGSLRPG